MKKALVVFALMALTANANARELEVIFVPETVIVNRQTLQLNGCGIREKFFFSIYLGALYTPRHVSSLAEVVVDPGDKLIRMTFLYKRVEKKKIVEAFAEGFSRNSPELAGAIEVRQFLALFTDDFVQGDRVDLELGAGGRVVARQNDRVLGTLNSQPLVRGILAIYLGDHPADDYLKSEMLGLNR